MRSTALLTDQYELTMVQACLRSGSAGRRVVFELFARHLPAGRRYGVVAGTGRFLDALDDFRFSDEQVAWLRGSGIVDDRTAQWLAGFRFRGDVWGYPEGEVYFGGSPVLVVEATFAEAVVLETLALSVLNHDGAVASAASRMVAAAGGRPCIEMGSRRTHEDAAVAAARAAYVGGFVSTSNLAAGLAHGIPTAGTSAHAFTLLHDTERDAFAAQIESLGPGTTLLVDTYDVAAAVRTAVEVAGTGLGKVRIDSGDLLDVAAQVREQLDSLGARDTEVVVTSDLDEHAIAALAAAPVDGFGVGTALVTGSGHPTCGFVYKMVARAVSDAPDAPMAGVAKHSPQKSTVAGRKWAQRRFGPGEVAVAEVVGTGGMPAGEDASRPLLVELVRRGERVWREPLAESRRRHRRSVAELPLAAHQLSRGEPVLPTVYETDRGPSR